LPAYEAAPAVAAGVSGGGFTTVSASSFIEWVGRMARDELSAAATVAEPPPSPWSSVPDAGASSPVLSPSPSPAAAGDDGAPVGAVGAACPAPAARAEAQEKDPESPEPTVAKQDDSR